MRMSDEEDATAIVWRRILKEKKDYRESKALVKGAEAGPVLATP